MGATCQYQFLTDKGQFRDKTTVLTSCKAEAKRTGFCEEHTYCHDTFMRAERLGFPRLEINEVFTVGAGRLHWHSYVCSLTGPDHVFSALANGHGVNRYQQTDQALRQEEQRQQVEAWERYQKTAEPEPVKTASKPPESAVPSFSGVEQEDLLSLFDVA